MRAKLIKNGVVNQMVIALLLLVMVTSCGKDDEMIPNLGILEIKLKLADGLKDISLSKIPVKITNVVDNSEIEKQTDKTGKVIFTNLPVGSYNISILKSNDTYVLSGTTTNVNIVKTETTMKIVEVNATNSNGGLVIKEIYSVGAADNYSSFFKDQFIEIFNNSSETLYADGTYIANLYGETGIHPKENPITEVLDIKEYVYADFIDQIPGDGKKYPIKPGKSIVIALNAINFKESSKIPTKAIDNTDATLERYSVEWLETKGLQGSTFFDLDNPEVPNMTNIYIAPPGGVYLFNSYGTGVVLVSKDVKFDDSGVVDYKQTNSSTSRKLMKVPVNKVIDGVEILGNSEAAKYKRIPTKIDAGFHYLKKDGNPFYSGMSSRRKKDKKASSRFGRVVLQDTNNSTVDFEALDKPDKYGYGK